jgi:hypothetical protein
MSELSSSQKALVGYMERSDVHAAKGFELILRTPAPQIFFYELKAKGLFDPLHNPKPQPAGSEGFFRVPYWSALGYLKRVAMFAKESDSVNLASDLLDVVRRWQTPGCYVDNYHTNDVSAEILGTVPQSCVSLDDIGLVESWLNTRWGNDTLVSTISSTVFPALLEDHSPAAREKAAALLRIVTEFRTATDGEKHQAELTSIADPYWLSELLKNLVRRLASHTGLPVFRCLLERTRTIFDQPKLANYAWLYRSTIEPSEHNTDWPDVKDTFVDATRDALDECISADERGIRDTVAYMLGDDSQIVRRIAVNALRSRWDKIGDVLEGNLSAGLFGRPLLHEMYHLLEERVGAFSQDTRQRIGHFILEIGNDHKEDDDDKSSRLRTMQNWFHAVRHHPEFETQYAALEAKLGPMREHPDLLSYSSTFVGSGPSPYSAEELHQLAAEGSLVSVFDAYEPTENDWRDPISSLVSALSQAVSDNPEWFVSYLQDQKAESASRRFQYGLLNGFKTVLRDKERASRVSDRSALAHIVATFLCKTIDTEKFWSEPVPPARTMQPDRNWIPPLAMDIVRTVMSNDDVALTGATKGLLLNTTLSILRHAEPMEYSEETLNAAINDTRGQAVDALVVAALRECRDFDKMHGAHEAAWATVSHYFDEQIALVKDAHFEVNAIFSSHLAQLLYMSKRWVDENVSPLFDRDRRKNFLASLHGLGFASSTVNVYLLLSARGIPRTALALDDVTGTTRERLIERVALAYMWSLEELDGPVVDAFFLPHRVADLVKFISTISRWSGDKITEEQRVKVNLLAARAVGISSSGVGIPVLAACSHLVSFFTDPAGIELDWVKLVAPHAHRNHGTNDFLKGLEAIVESRPRLVAESLRAMLQNHVPAYDYEGRLERILRALLESGDDVPLTLELIDRLVRDGGQLHFASLIESLRSG